MKVKAQIYCWGAVAGLLLLLATPCQAQSTCPWLNTATASGFLGGTASVEVDPAGAAVGGCSFHLQSGTPNDKLRIVVANVEHAERAGEEMKSYAGGCSAPKSALKGVGNEAVLCASDTKAAHGELVVGRVRDRIFTVAISTATGDYSEAALAEKAEAIARQVAGALF